jgi:hypothetical protein
MVAGSNQRPPRTVIATTTGQHRSDDRATLRTDPLRQQLTRLWPGDRSRRRPAHRLDRAGSGPSRWALAPAVLLAAVPALTGSHPAAGEPVADAAPSDAIAPATQPAGAPDPVGDTSRSARSANARGEVRPTAHRARLVLRPRAEHRRHRRVTTPKRPHVPLAPSNAAETVRSARQSSSYPPGQCLAWSRGQADIPARYPDAATAWAHATGKRPGDRTPPVGAAVYWTGGSNGYGHVAISVGRGRVRSTDAPGPGQVDTVPVRWVAREWGLEYAGWSDSINGYRIPGVAR